MNKRCTEQIYLISNEEEGEDQTERTLNLKKNKKTLLQQTLSNFNCNKYTPDKLVDFLGKLAYSFAQCSLLRNEESHPLIQNNRKSYNLLQNVKVPKEKARYNLLNDLAKWNDYQSIKKNFVERIHPKVNEIDFRLFDRNNTKRCFYSLFNSKKNSFVNSCHATPI